MLLYAVIDGALRYRWIVLMICAALFIAGIWAVKKNPVDVIPDLSENQVIVFTPWNGQTQRTIEDQITYPLMSALQGLPRVKYTRGVSMFAMSFLYVVFEDEVDMYWARERVSERLASAKTTLPVGVQPELGPDGTGAGHVLWYTLDAPDMDLGEQRALQDWYIKFGLQNVAGVSEIASFGGFEKQYQITFDPNKLRFYGLALQDIIRAVRENNNETGGGKMEMSGMGYVLQTAGYLTSIRDIENIVIGDRDRTSIYVRDVARVQLAGAPRLGIIEQDGEGERVGGIVVMRQHENVINVISRVRAKMKELQKGFPPNTRFDIVYDRGVLVREAIRATTNTLVEEMVVVSIIVLIFLSRLRAALAIILQIPLSIALCFLCLQFFSISSNIMSLTGVALAIGVIVDNGIIIAENVSKRLGEKQAEKLALMKKER